MNKVVAILLIAFAAGVSAASTPDLGKGNFGAEPSVSAPEPKTRAKRNSYPFAGEVESIDKTNLKLKGKRKPRILLITPETRVLRDGKSASFSDAKPGERVSGSARKNADGQEEAVTVNLKAPQDTAK